MKQGKEVHQVPSDKMGRRRNSGGLSLHILTAILGLMCSALLAGAQEATNVTTTDGGESDGTSITVTDQLARRADENQRMSFSGDADFEARRPRGLLAALFGYPDEFENSETPASDSGYGVQEENSGRNGGTPPPRFKASHYNTSKKPTFAIKTTTQTSSTTTVPTPKSVTNGTDTFQEKTSASNVSETTNSTDTLDTQEQNADNSSSTEGTSGNKREVGVPLGRGMRTGRNSAQARPLPAGYILWHPVPASFLKGQNDGGHESMALSSEMKHQMIGGVGGNNGPFIPHQPFFVQPNMNGAELNRLPFGMSQFSVAQTPSDGPVDNKAATKLHKQIERERNRENRDRKKKAKKQRQKDQKANENEGEEDDQREEHGQNEEKRPPQQQQHQTPQMMLPPLPMNGFPDGPFHEQRPFEQLQRPDRPLVPGPPPPGPPQPIHFNRDFPPAPQMHPQQQQRPFPNEQPHGMPPPGSMQFAHEHRNIDRRPPPPPPLSVPNTPDFENQNRPFENHNRPFENNNRPFDNNNRPFENNNRPFDNHRIFENHRVFENHRIFENHNMPFENHNRPEGAAGSLQIPRVRDRPSPSPSAHPAKFEIEHHDRLQQHQREMVEHQFQREPLPPLPPPPPPHFPPAHFPPPFNDQRPFPKLPPPPPPPPLGAASRDNGHGFRDSSSPPTQQLDASPFVLSNRPNFKDLPEDQDRLQPLDFQQALPAPSQLPPFVGVTNPSIVHSGSPHVSFDQSSTLPIPTQSPTNFEHFNTFSGPPPPTASPAPHHGMNDHEREQFIPHNHHDKNHNNGLIYSRDFKKAVAEANIVLPNQNFGPQTENRPHFNENVRTISRSSTTTALPPAQSSTFGLPPTIIPNRSLGDSSTLVPHRPPRPPIRTDNAAPTPSQQHRQQPFTEVSQRPHPHQVSPAATHRLPQASPHPNLPDFRPNPTTIRSDRSDTPFELQREENVQVESTSSPLPQRARDSYKSPGFHTGHKGYPSSVTAPNQVSSSEQSTQFTVTARASPTVKSNIQTLQSNDDSTTARSPSTSPAYGYVRHTQSSRSQPSASFSYEIKYQSPAPQIIVNNYSSTQPPKLSITTQSASFSPTTTSRPHRSYRPRPTPQLSAQSGIDRRNQQPDIV